MKVYPKSRLLDIANAYPAIVAGLALLSGVAIAGCVLIGVPVPGAVLTVFQLSGGILLGLIGFVIFLLLIAGLANGIIWLVKQ